MMKSFLRASARERAAAVRVVAYLAGVRAGLRVLPADKLARLLRIPVVLAVTDPAPGADLGAVPPARRPEMRAFDLLLRRRPSPSASRCLEQSMTIAMILRSVGAHLRLGVARDGDALLAHAWVEWQGRSLLANPTFLPLGESAPARQ